jgi:hypothetical protein
VQLRAAVAARAPREPEFISGPEVPQAAAMIARAIVKRRAEWRESLVQRLAAGESLYDVGVVERTEMQTEAVELRVEKIVVRLRREGKPAGREPKHAEFVEGLLHDAEAGYAASEAKRQRAASGPPVPKNGS